MKLRSPTLEGFRTMFRQPSLGLAEVAWRWSFAMAAALLFAFSAVEYLDTLPVTSGELFLLRTGQPVLVARAVDHILRGSALRAVLATLVLTLALALAWMAIASLARAATVKALLEYLRQDDAASVDRGLGVERKSRPGALIGLNFLRAGTTIAAALGFLGAILLARFASPDSDPSPAAAMLVAFFLFTLVGLAWLVVNWFLSLAAVFTIAGGQDTFGALASAVDLCRTRLGPIAAASTWFGLAHLVVFLIATSAVAFPLAFAGVIPASAVFGGVLLVTFLYFGAVDFLYVGRLAAYVTIVEQPDVPVASPATSLPPSDQSQFSANTAQARESVDPDDLILSDVPSATS
jgi:hypothetical protein